MKKLFLLMILLATFVTGFSQPKAGIIITGKLTNRSTGESIGGATISLKKSGRVTITDSTGAFQLEVITLPATLFVTHVGFEEHEIIVQKSLEVSIDLEPNVGMLEGVVLTSKGLPTRIIDAPFSAEYFGQRRIRNLPAPSIYDATVYMKGVDQTTSSLTFKTPST